MVCLIAELLCGCRLIVLLCRDIVYRCVGCLLVGHIGVVGNFGCLMVFNWFVGVVGVVWWFVVLVVVL